MLMKLEEERKQQKELADKKEKSGENVSGVKCLVIYSGSDVTIILDIYGLHSHL